jgi:8-oxo-dGTP pyrophosphatase MutT (NUDIX family)
MRRLRIEGRAVKDWRSRIEANLRLPRVARERSLFSEINPGLVGDRLFESRWAAPRMEAAVLVPIIERACGPKIILTVRAADLPSHAGQISFPGGRRQPEDDGPVATALREAEEEVNIARSEVAILGSLGVHRGGLGFSVTPVVGLVDARASLRPCAREVAEIFEVPLEFLADLGNHRTEQRRHEGVLYNMYAVPWGRYHIWGLTAGILKTLAEVFAEEPGRAAAE